MGFGVTASAGLNFRCVQTPDDVAWIRRKEWLKCILMRHTVTHAPVPEDDVTALLTDHRLVETVGRVVSNKITGIAVSFLSRCCEYKLCPLGLPCGQVRAIHAASPEPESEVDEDEL